MTAELERAIRGNIYSEDVGVCKVSVAYCVNSTVVRICSKDEKTCIYLIVRLDELTIRAIPETNFLMNEERMTKFESFFSGLGQSYDEHFMVSFTNSESLISAVDAILKYMDEEAK